MTPTRLALHFNPQLADQQTVQNFSAVVFHNDHLWLASDETNSLHRFHWTGSNFQDHTAYPLADLIPLHGKPKEEIDIEGLAYHDGHLWLTGSHSLRMPKWDSKRTPAENIHRLAYSKSKEDLNRYMVARIPIPNEDPAPGATLVMEHTPTVVLANDDHLGAIIQARVPAKANGMDVEGLALLPDGHLLFGLRGPVFLDRALVLLCQPKQPEGQTFRLNKLDGQSVRYQKLFIHLHGLGIRDLLVVDQSLYILAGPTMDLNGPTVLYCLHDVEKLKPDSDIQPELLFKLPERNEPENPEGIAMMTKKNTQGILVIPDSPGPSRFPSPGLMELDWVPLH